MNKVMIKIIKAYQNKISPQTQARCRHTPTCSNYGIQCYQEHHFVKATYLTTKRILTCNPLFKPKYDPVPPNFKKIFTYGINLNKESYHQQLSNKTINSNDNKD